MVVGTYPKPMLVFMFDEGGLDSIPSKTLTLPPDYIRFDCVAEDIVWIKPEEIDKFLAVPTASLPKITAIDFNDTRIKQMDLTFKAIGNSEPMSKFMTVLNKLVTADGRTLRSELPWKTIVLDPVTGFSDIVLAHIAAFNSEALKDARQWASQIGDKVKQMVGVVTSLQAHVVIILHTQLDKNELTGTIIELPAIYGSYREKMGGGLSQLFYATKVNGKPVIYTTDQMFVRGIGARWPLGLKPIHEPDFKSIYGKELGIV